ncbi:hypothetical protein J2Z83_002861 [Virgibacillus natechei]|uniref:Uncharacterized protein n=1 Tax=Virgibacillus natechei TaxID=1216297 RepID=A0ABS4III0_9BACI|nr:hypothetical protein [Virgibacillus natechei]
MILRQPLLNSEMVPLPASSIGLKDEGECRLILKNLFPIGRGFFSVHN